jgi:hypothetical protein
MGAIQLPSTRRAYCSPLNPWLMVTALPTIWPRHQSAARAAKMSCLGSTNPVWPKMSCMARKATRVPAAS